MHAMNRVKVTVHPKNEGEKSCFCSYNDTHWGPKQHWNPFDFHGPKEKKTF